MLRNYWLLSWILTFGVIACNPPKSPVEEPEPADTSSDTDTTEYIEPSYPAWEDTDPTDVPVIDHSFACYPYRIHSYSGWSMSAVDLVTIDASNRVLGTQSNGWNHAPIAFQNDIFFSFNERDFGELIFLAYEDPTGLPEMSGVTAADINDQGVIVGTGEDSAATPVSHAIWADAADNMHLVFDDGRESGAEAVNGANTVVGWYAELTAEIPPVLEQKAFVWTGALPVTTVMHPESDPLVPSSLQSHAYDVSEGGVVVAAGTDVAGNWRPFTWSAAAGAVDLPTLGGAEGHPLTIHENGDIVGYSQDLAGVFRPTLWRGGEAIELGWPSQPSTKFGRATAVNLQGDVVGWDGVVNYPDGTARAWIYREGESRDLTEMINPATQLTIAEPVAISDTGVILAHASHPSFAESLAVALVPQACE